MPMKYLSKSVRPSLWLKVQGRLEGNKARNWKTIRQLLQESRKRSGLQVKLHEGEER